MPVCGRRRERSRSAWRATCTLWSWIWARSRTRARSCGRSTSASPCRRALSTSRCTGTWARSRRRSPSRPSRGWSAVRVVCLLSAVCCCLLCAAVCWCWCCCCDEDWVCNLAIKKTNKQNQYTGDAKELGRLLVDAQTKFDGPESMRALPTQSHNSNNNHNTYTSHADDGARVPVAADLARAAQSPEPSAAAGADLWRQGCRISGTQTRKCLRCLYKRGVTICKGDGTAQLLAKDGPAQQAMIDIVHRDFPRMHCLSLTVPRHHCRHIFVVLVYRAVICLIPPSRTCTCTRK